MASSLSFLVQHFLAHPEHRFLLERKILLYPKLADRFNALQKSDSEEKWMEWFELFERVAPFLIQTLVGEISSILYGSAPDLDAFDNDAPPDPTVAEGSQIFLGLGPEETQSLLQQIQPNQERKQMALRNSSLVYGKGEGTHRFLFDVDTGELVPSETEFEKGKEVVCVLQEEGGKPLLKELRLILSQNRELSYHDQKWHWINRRKMEQEMRIGIQEITRVLPAEGVVDLLLDLISPGLFFQATDASVSVSLSRRASTGTPLEGPLYPAPTPPPQPSPAASSSAPQETQDPPSASLSSQGERAVLSRSPFAARPDSVDEAETTQERPAILQPARPMVAPRELSIEREPAPSWIRRIFGASRSSKREELDILQVGDTRHFQELGLLITFLIESSSTTVFPWVTVVREAEAHEEIAMELLWNGAQKQPLPPDFKSTGALSRNPDVGALLVKMTRPHKAPEYLHIRWRA